MRPPRRLFRMVPSKVVFTTTLLVFCVALFNVITARADRYSVVATIPVGHDPCALAVNATTNTLYVADYADNAVSVIDGTTNLITKTIPVGTYPFAVAV